MNGISLLVGGVVSMVAAAALATAGQDCLNNPNRVGACRAVHGRLSFWNGNPAERIWVVGTKRILGVTSRSESSLPGYLRGQLAWDVDLYGDYWVCPLYDPPKEGQMEFVCVHSWRNLVSESPAAAGARRLVKRLPNGPAPRWPDEEP